MEAKDWLNSIGITVTEKSFGFLLERKRNKLPIYTKDLEVGLQRMPKVHRTLDDFLFNFSKENPALVINIHHVYNYWYNKVAEFFGDDIEELIEKYKV